jgi:hypothetical protein
VNDSLVATSTTLVDLGTPAINTIYNVFAVKNSDTSEEVLFDTDVNGAGLPGTVDHKRWLGFVRTNASGDICKFSMAGDRIVWHLGSETNLNSLITTPANCTTAVDFSALAPPSRVKSLSIGGVSVTSQQSVCVGVDGANSDGTTTVSFDNTSDGDIRQWTALGYTPVEVYPTSSNIYWGDGTWSNNAGTSRLRLKEVTLRR